MSKRALGRVFFGLKKPIEKSVKLADKPDSVH
jgi:hypothetical protein